MTDRLTSPSLVSIIVPVYNGERYLRQSLDSILGQTYTHTEVLVMDDASTDDTPDIIASYGARLECHRQPQNRGIYGNANDGIGLARGEYICVYHADDVYHPSIVEREVEFLEQYPESGAVFCQDVFIDPLGREDGRLELPTEVRGGRPLDYAVVFNCLLKYENRFLRCPSSMVRASVYQDVGTYRDEEFFNTSDLEMWLRIASKYPIGIIEEYLLSYRHDHGSSAQRYHHLRTDPTRFFRIMDLYLEEGGRSVARADALAAYEAHRAEDRLKIAINHYILGQMEPARENLRQVRASRLFGSGQVQRGRLMILLLALGLLVRVPRISQVGDLFYRHWYTKGNTAKEQISR